MLKHESDGKTLLDSIILLGAPRDIHIRAGRFLDVIHNHKDLYPTHIQSNRKTIYLKIKHYAPNPTPGTSSLSYKISGLTSLPNKNLFTKYPICLSPYLAWNQLGTEKT